MSKEVVSKKKRSGRPRKFDEDMLLEGVKNYIRKNSSHPAMIKTTKVAKYLQELGLNVTYQDLGRYEKVKQYIEKYNERFKEMIFGNGLISVDANNNEPVYEKIDVKSLIKNNKTEKDIEKAVLMLNESNEKLVQSYSKLEDKVILQAEKIISQDKEIKTIKSDYEAKEANYLSEIEGLKMKLKEATDKNKKTAKKIEMYDYFISRFHYSKLAEYALYLESIISNEECISSELLDAVKYKKGEAKLSDIVDEYQKLMLSVENQSNLTSNNIDFDVFNNDSEEAVVLEEVDGISLDDIDLEDMESSINDILGSL